MKALTRTFNFASPWGGVLALAALIVFGWLIFVALGGVGFRFDPFNSAEKRAERAETRAVTAEIDAGARAQEAAGAKDTTRRVEAALTQVRQADAIAADFTSQARAAHDANQPLDSDRADRIRLADERLCDTRPAVCDADAPASRDARYR